MKLKICIRCQKEIKEKDNYLRITEYTEGKQDKENYVHKNCWDEFINPKMLAMGMVGRTLKLLNKAEGIMA